MAAKEEKRRNEENMKQLLQLLNAASQERDEANNQLQRLMNKITLSSTTEPSQILLNLQPESPPQMIPTIGNSSLTEADSFSDTYNRHSHASSVDSFLDGVSSPDLTNMNVADSSHTVLPKQPLLHDHNVNLPTGIISSDMSRIDPASAIINQIALKRPLPEKGKLLQAVMDAGPLLRTLLVAGPLPQWRNPPPVHSLQIPPVSIQGCDPMPVVPESITNPRYPIKNSVVPCHENLNSASQLEEWKSLQLRKLNCPSAFFSVFIPAEEQYPSGPNLRQCEMTKFLDNAWT
ncbi:hypothetical protein ACLOJK_001685 [Asimina triloba]